MDVIRRLQVLLVHKRIMLKRTPTDQIQHGPFIHKLGGGWTRRADSVAHPRLDALLPNIAAVIGTMACLPFHAPKLAGCFRLVTA
jgi:hypothetical protein